MPQPITFVIPAYNAADYLSAAVDSILDGNLSAGDEIVIVDDASTDQTPAIIEKLTTTHPFVRGIRHRFNKGSAAAARNSAIDVAGNDLIFCLDADNLLYPASVPALRDFLLDHRLDAAAFQKVDLFIDHPHLPHSNVTFAAGSITLADALAGHNWPGFNGNYLFTRQSWINAGRYPEDIGGVIDSWAFGIRQLASGSTLHTLESAAYLHRFGHESASTRGLVRNNQAMNALAVLLPILDRLEDESVAYLFDPASRKDWNLRLAERPLRVKNLAAAPDVSRTKMYPRRWSVVQSIRARLGRLIAGS